MVKAGTGTLPHASDHPEGPSRATSRSASSADSVSFHSLAGRSTSPWPSRTTSPCCWAATATAATSLALPSGPADSSAVAIEVASAAHQASGSCSLRGGPEIGWAARPAPTTLPVARSRSSTLVDCVDESTPATNGMPATLQRPSGRGGTKPLAQAAALQVIDLSLTR